MGKGVRYFKQSPLIAPNSNSLAWADLNPRCDPMGVYRDDQMIGFAMCEPRGNKVFSVHRLMIDQSFQRQGAGLLAMQLVMDKIFSPGAVTIYLGFRPENAAAKGLFEKLDYVFHIEEPDGEIVSRYGPERDIST